MLKSYLKVCGDRNPPGIKARLYIAECCDLVSTPQTVLEMTPASTDPEAAITIAEPFEMVLTKTFKYFDIVIDTGGWKSSKIGEVDAEAFTNGIRFRIAGTGPKEVARFLELSTVCGVGIVETSANYRFNIGTKERPFHCESAELDSGAALTDPNGADYVMTATSGLPPLYYPAALALAIDPPPA